MTAPQKDLFYADCASDFCLIDVIRSFAKEKYKVSHLV